MQLESLKLFLTFDPTFKKICRAAENCSFNTLNYLKIPWINRFILPSFPSLCNFRRSYRGNKKRDSRVRRKTKSRKGPDISGSKVTPFLQPFSSTILLSVPGETAVWLKRSLTFTRTLNIPVYYIYFFALILFISHLSLSERRYV